MSKPFDLTHHKALWNWLADNPEKEKEDWVGWVWCEGDVGEVKADCFACDSVDGDCDICPLDECKIGCFNGLYDRWYNSDSLLKRSNLAREIANLPVKEGVETI